jgi:hypothetical protein
MKLSLATISSDFSVEIAAEVAGQSYFVKIISKTTAATCYEQIQLQAESASFGRPLNCKINANVK